MTEQEAVENFKGENKILSQYAESKFQKEVFAKKIERNNMAIKALEKQKYNGWIPCSERLPEAKEKRFGNKQKRTEVLVTLRNGLVKEMTFEFATKEFWEAGDENWIEHWKEDANDSGCEVIAWQPLPEPYKECVEDDKCR